MQGRHFLHIPGPSPIPDRILRAIAMPIIDHRSAEFAALGKEVLEGSKAVFKTKQPVVIYPASGTGAWEAAITNMLSPGDTVLMRQKSTGTLVLDALTPGKRLFMISTGTGIAPFASLLRDPDTYEKFEHVYLTHTCRDVAELAYGQELVASLAEDPLIGEFTNGRVTLYNSTTRETSDRMGRITALVGSGKFYTDLGIEALNPETDRIMICGSMHMLKDVKEMAENLGFVEGSLSAPASFVVERAFVG